jgi:hypothetical protein
MNECNRLSFDARCPFQITIEMRTEGFNTKNKKRGAHDNLHGPQGQSVACHCLSSTGYFGWTLGLPPGLPGGGITGILPVSGVGAFIPASTSGGQMTPALRPNFWPRGWSRSCLVQPCVSVCAKPAHVVARSVAAATTMRILVLLIHA